MELSDSGGISRCPEHEIFSCVDDIFGESEQIDKARGNIRNKKIKDCDGIDH